MTATATVTVDREIENFKSTHFSRKKSNSFPFFPNFCSLRSSLFGDSQKRQMIVYAEQNEANE